MERGQPEPGALPASERPTPPAVIVERGREAEPSETYAPPRRPTRSDLASAPDAANEAAVLAVGSQLAPPTRSVEQTDPKSPAAFVRQMEAYLAGPDDASGARASLTISQPTDQLTAGRPLVIPGGANVMMNVPDAAAASASPPASTNRQPSDSLRAVSAEADLRQTEQARDPAGLERMEIDERAKASEKRAASKAAEQGEAVQQTEDRRSRQLAADNLKEAQRRAAKPDEDEERRARNKPAGFGAA